MLEPLLAYAEAAGLTTVQIALLPIGALIGYTVLGITGFGATLVSSVLLAHVYPLKFLIPMHSLLDVSGALAFGHKFAGEADRKELVWLIPIMLTGMAIGLTLLIHLPARASLFLLGMFVFAYAAYSLSGGLTGGRAPKWWGLPFGLVGGVFSALFGTGGPLYVIYLSRRVEDVRAVRSTVSIMINIAAFVRVVMFAFAGLYANRAMWICYAVGLPFALAGIWLGRRLHDRLPVAGIRRAILWLLGATSISLLVRAVF